MDNLITNKFTFVAVYKLSEPSSLVADNSTKLFETLSGILLNYFQSKWCSIHVAFHVDLCYFLRVVEIRPVQWGFPHVSWRVNCRYLTLNWKICLENTGLTVITPLYRFNKCDAILECFFSIVEVYTDPQKGIFLVLDCSTIGSVSVSFFYLKKLSAKILSYVTTTYYVLENVSHIINTKKLCRLPHHALTESLWLISI